MYIFNNKYSYRDLGLLFLRVGIGLMFVFHGLPKIMGGAEKWAEVGAAMQFLGIHQYYEMWGYMAAFAEFGGGILLIFGMLHRFVCFLLLCTMVVASTKQLAGGSGILGASHPIEVAILFLSLLLIGPGKFSFDQLLFSRN